MACPLSPQHEDAELLWPKGCGGPPLNRGVGWLALEARNMRTVTTCRLGMETMERIALNDALQGRGKACPGKSQHESVNHLGAAHGAWRGHWERCLRETWDGLPFEPAI